MGSLMSALAKYFKKHISEHLIRTHKCAYQGVRNVSFGENFAYLLSE